MYGQFCLFIDGSWSGATTGVSTEMPVTVAGDETILLRGVKPVTDLDEGLWHHDVLSLYVSKVGDKPLIGRNELAPMSPVAVLKGIDLDVEPGEVLALVGENGAGKSTLMRIVAGLAKPTAGDAQFDMGAAPGTLVAAEAAGIIMVHQKFCLVPHLTVSENVFLGREIRKGPFTDTATIDRPATETLAQLGSTARPRARLKDSPVSDWQMIGLAKAFARRPRLLLMDEPTAVLSGSEAARLFEKVRQFRASGGSVIFTSHRLNEAKEISDRVAVLRDGQIVRVELTAGLSEGEMAEAMVGRPLAEIYPAKRAPQDAPLRLAVVAVDETDVPRMTIFGQRAADDQLEVFLSVVAVADVSAIQADDDAAIRNGQVHPVARASILHEGDSFFRQLPLDTAGRATHAAGPSCHWRRNRSAARRPTARRRRHRARARPTGSPDRGVRARCGRGSVFAEVRSLQHRSRRQSVAGNSAGSSAVRRRIAFER